MLGATGTIGRATVRALARRGHTVVCFVRPGAVWRPNDPKRCEVRYGDVTDAQSLTSDGLRGDRFDVLVSCLASRTGAPDDAWRIDYQAHVDALAASKAAGVRHVVLLSAICVQKPLLAFQKAKLAFEGVLIECGLTYSIVRPTAFFKSLSGQVERLKKGKPFLLFGNGNLTACKPISDDDLAAFLADCVTDHDKRDKILPIGGPGDAITPQQQGAMLFAVLGMPPRYRRLPVGVLDVVIRLLSAVGRVIPPAARKAELARIGRYYATESMLVLDPQSGRYSAQATPSAGAETLESHFRRLVRGEAPDDRGDHAVF